MNVAFHAIGSFAAAAVLSRQFPESRPVASVWKKYVVGFVTGILIHGVLDFSPHNYPLASKFDVVLALFLLGLCVIAAKKQNRLLLLVCFGGAIFPDLVDLSAGIANKHLGVPLPQLSFKIFPWHWKRYSGSIYDGSRSIESTVYHILVLLIGLGLLCLYQNDLFKRWKGKE